MAETIKLQGFRDLDRALEQLSKSMGKAVLRRAGIEAAEPMARMMRQKAPKDTDDLSESIDVSTKLSNRQGSLHRKMFRNDRSSVELFVGPGKDPAAWVQEFGNVTNGAQPFVRPAFDQDWRAFIERLRVDLSDQLQKSAERAARKEAKLR